MKRILLGLLLVVFTYELTITDADAWILRRLFRGRRSYSSTSGGGNYAFTGNAQAVAEQKANLQASRNRMFHPGGSFGGATYEGVGRSNTAQGALNNCCYTGQKRVVGQAVAQGSNGSWYACKLYID